MNENDLRVRRTRTLLRQAFIELVNSQEYESITVRDITKKAQVGYKTFYRHYEGKDALLQTLVNEIRDEFQQHLLPPSDERAPHENTLTTLTFIENHQQLFLMLLNSSAADQLLNMATAFALEEGKQTFHSPHIPDALMAHHFASSMISLFRWWLESGPAHTKEEMVAYIHQLLILPMQQLSAP